MFCDYSMGEWQHGLCGCFDNCGLCILSFWCNCVVVGQIGEKMGENCVVFALLGALFPPIPHIVLRRRIRSQNGIEVRQPKLYSLQRVTKA